MAKKQEMVPFKKIKKGGFFRIKRGGCLMQRGKVGDDNVGQVVTGKNTGHAKYFDGYDKYTPDTLVIPVNAKIIEEK